MFIQKAIQCFLQELHNRRNTLNIMGPNEIVAHHVEDCLVALGYFYEQVQHIVKNLASPCDTQHSIPCVDLGTGAGFPGILLALCFYACNIPTHWYLLEKSPKKCAFLQDSISTLNNVFSIQLPITVINNNLYHWSLSHDRMCQPVLVTARAFRPLTVPLIEAIVHAVGQATLLLYKGRKENIEQELEHVKNSAHIHIHAITPLLCSHGKERHLVHCTLST